MADTVSSGMASKPTLDNLTDSAFARLSVIRKLPVPGYPKPAEEQREDAGTYEQFLERWQRSFLDIARLEDGSRLAFSNKTNPHARFDSMLLQVDREVRTAVSDLTLPQARFVMDTGHDFVEWISDAAVVERFGLDGGCLHLVFNTDPHTFDRENGMGYTKRFHLHMNYWPREDVEAGRTMYLGDIDDVQRRRLLDPVTVAAGWMLREIAEREAIFRGHEIFAGSAETEVERKLAPGFKVRLSSGWPALRDPRFLDDLRRFHLAMTSFFEDVQEAFTGQRTPAPPGTRHNLLQRDEIARRIGGLRVSTSTAESLLVLAAVLRNVSERFLRRTESHPAMRKRHLAMNGLNYSTGLYTPHRNRVNAPVRDANDVWLVIQVKLFSDVGGAGMIYNSEAGVVEIARRARLFTGHEMALRVDFQQQFLDFTRERAAYRKKA